MRAAVVAPFAARVPSGALWRNVGELRAAQSSSYVVYSVTVLPNAVKSHRRRGKAGMVTSDLLTVRPVPQSDMLLHPSAVANANSHPRHQQHLS